MMLPTVLAPSRVTVVAAEGVRPKLTTAPRVVGAAASVQLPPTPPVVQRPLAAVPLHSEEVAVPMRSWMAVPVSLRA